jgi:signal transduction histidine kinase
VVDDEKPLAERLVRLFEQSCWHAESVHCGEDALLRTKDKSFDVILLDMRMPGMDGFVLLERLIAHDPGQCVVFHTAYGDVSSAVQALQMGAWTMVEKGPPFRELFAKVENARKQCASRRESAKQMALLQEQNRRGEEMRLRLEVNRTLAQAATHKLKTRLAACGSSMLDIQEATTDPKILRPLVTLRENLDLTELSLKNLFEICRLDAGDSLGAISIVSQNVCAAVDKGFCIARRLAGRRTQVVTLRSVIGEELMVRCAEDRLTDIFEECLVNAIQAAFDRNLTITIAANRVDDTICIKILDDGPGFDKNVLDTAHLPYVTTKRGKGGKTPASNFGLGLYLVKSMVEQSGGTLIYSNVPAGGACIEMTLPAG